MSTGIDEQLTRTGNAGRKSFGVLALLAACAIAAATLWPFNPKPANEVSWLEGADGLRFGDYGTVFGRRPFEGNHPGSRLSTACSAEIWLEPGATEDTNTIVDFYTPQDPSRFAIRQEGDSLLVVGNALEGETPARKSVLEVEHAFRQGAPLHIAVSSGAGETIVYLNGHRVKAAAAFGFASPCFSGELVIGNSPVGNNTWSGVLRGLALYNEELQPAQVRRHYEQWVNRGGPEEPADPSTVALYTFRERGGNVVRNQVASEPSLSIPKTYTILHPPFLEMPWKEFHPGWSYIKDAGVNIAGFAPLGFLLCGYLLRTGHSSRAALFTVLAGALFSLAIEMLQAFLPSRISGLTDVITNTLGAGIGAWLAQTSLIRNITRRLDIL